MPLRILPKPRIIPFSKPKVIEAARHDAGGSKRWQLQEGIVGGAHFSADGCYRHSLVRTRKEGYGYILWIGHNPSVAESNIDDPTIRREMEFTWRGGFQWMIKCNLMDYRATHPEQLLDENYRNYLPAFSANNFETIVRFAHEAKLIVMSYGVLNARWMPVANRVMDELSSYQNKMVCLGKTKNGFPRHPLYVPGNKEFEQFYGD